MPRYCDSFSIPFILQKLLHDHRMDSIVHCSSSTRDRRAFFYFVSLAKEDKVVCFHVRSLKNSRDVTVSLVCICLTLTCAVSMYYGDAVPYSLMYIQ